MTLTRTAASSAAPYPLPKITAAIANLTDSYRLRPEGSDGIDHGLLTLIANAQFADDDAFLALIAGAGIPAVLAACRNPYLSDRTWIALYDTTRGYAHHALVAQRLLSVAQREHLVASKEKHAFTLGTVACQLDESELVTLAALKLPPRAREVVDTELSTRRSGTPELRRADGRGLRVDLLPKDVDLLTEDEEDEEYGDPDLLGWDLPDRLLTDDVADLGVADDGPNPFVGKDQQREWAGRVHGYVSAKLSGQPVQVWFVLGQLAAAQTGTWGALTTAAVAITA